MFTLNILSVIFYYPSQYNTIRWLSIVHNKIVSDKKICNNVENIKDIKWQRVGTLIAMEQSLPGNFFTKRSKTYDLAGSGMFSTYIFYKKKTLKKTAVITISLENIAFKLVGTIYKP